MTDIVTYFYEIEGGAADGQTWATDGTVEAAGHGQFMQAVREATHRSFVKMANGEAVFGNLNIRCDGPYHITKLIITERGKT